jgi:hypothetical protein
MAALVRPWLDKPDKPVARKVRYPVEAPTSTFDQGQWLAPQLKSECTTAIFTSVSSCIESLRKLGRPCTGLAEPRGVPAV